MSIGACVVTMSLSRRAADELERLQQQMLSALREQAGCDVQFGLGKVVESLLFGAMEVAVPRVRIQEPALPAAEDFAASALKVLDERESVSGAIELSRRLKLGQKKTGKLIAELLASGAIVRGKDRRLRRNS